MLVVDTNVLLYAANQDSALHASCRSRLDELRRGAAPVFLTWSICYEFLRVATHPRVLRSPWTAVEAWRFLDTLMASPGVEMLVATDRHAAVLSQTVAELNDVNGNLFHDLHIAVLMREHGIGRVLTRDTDFHRFPFLEVIDPMR